MFRASPFRIDMFRQCPRRYKFYYVDKVREIYEKPRPYFTMGEHVHAALKDFLSSVPVAERTPSRLEDLLQAKWQRYRRGFQDSAEEREWWERALRQVRWFASSQDLAATPYMVEDYHEATLSSSVAVLGRIDRVDRESEGTLHIIDYKTGKMPEQTDALQLNIYALILSRKQEPPVTRASYLYLDAGEWRTVQPTRYSLEQAADYVLRNAETILEERAYPATPNPFCGTCDFREVCPRKAEIVTVEITEEALDL